MKVLQLIILTCCVKLNNCQNCKYFNYVENQGEIVGRIDIENDFSGYYKIEVIVTFATHQLFDNDNIEIERTSTESDILNGGDLVYQLRFPRRNYFPKLTSIEFNEKILCAAPPEDVLHGVVTSLAVSDVYSSPIGLVIMPNRTQQQNPVKTAASYSTDEYSATVNKLNIPSTAQPPFMVEKFCGIVDNSVQLIAHGEDARKSNYPWLGALFKQSRAGVLLVCAATLFTKRHALTAAHCVHGSFPSRFNLVLGRDNLEQWLSEGEQVQITDIYVHERFQPKHGDCDIAILKLSRDIRFSSVIRPICLWNTDDNLQYVVGSTGVVVGWGHDENGKQGTTPKKTNLPIVSQEDCLTSHRAYYLLTSTRTFCAGYRNDSGPCIGDGGSGFYMKVAGRWFIRGVVSLTLAANNTCDLKNFVVFADAAKFKDWILEYING